MRSGSSARAVPLPTTPEAALVTEHGPGPEGAAERFAAKLSAGLFGRDLSLLRVIQALAPLIAAYLDEAPALAA